MEDACEPAAVGLDCFCLLGGVTPTTEPLPAGCMQSGELVVAVPSSLEMTLNAMKPGNVSQEARVGGVSPHPHARTAEKFVPAARRWC